jgi:succinoglycan biosynthesis transport protein ExoP
MTSLLPHHRVAERSSPQGREVRGATGRLPSWDQYAAFLRRYRRLLAVAMGIGVVLGAGVSFVQQPTYSATTSIALTPVPSYMSVTTTGGQPGLVSIDTDARLVMDSSAVQALERADPAVREPEEQIVVTATPLSRVMHITYSSGSPETAAAGATAVGDAFIDARRDALGALAEPELERLRLRIAELQERLSLEEARGLVPTTPDALEPDLLELRDRLAALESARDTPAEVLQEALPPSAPDRRNAEVPITSGAMIGLLVGWVAALARNRHAVK